MCACVPPGMRAGHKTVPYIYVEPAAGTRCVALWLNEIASRCVACAVPCRRSAMPPPSQGRRIAKSTHAPCPAVSRASRRAKRNARRIRPEKSRSACLPVMETERTRETERERERGRARESEEEREPESQEGKHTLTHTPPLHILIYILIYIRVCFSSSFYGGAIFI